VRIAENLKVGDVIFVKEFMNDWRKVEAIHIKGNTAHLRIQNSKNTHSIQLSVDRTRMFAIQE
jgi:hypothetical protein